MRRREAVQTIGAVIALRLIPRNAQAAIELGEQIHRRVGDVPFRTLNPEQQKLVTQIAEMIIPETDTPGATSVKVPEFIDLILTEWASDEEKAAFLAGLADIDVQTAAGMGAPKFVELAEGKRGEFLTGLDAKRPAKVGAAHAFERIKALTVYGYFTSQAVQTDILKTRMFFNGYDGNVPFTPRV
jgi:glucoside 3-dehydrogenase (cytochrome c) hitch-hiker subunit